MSDFGTGACNDPSADYALGDCGDPTTDFAGSSGDCPPPGDCPDGQECLPSDYIDPDDCPGCPDGQECLPSNFIDPDDCPGCDPGETCLPEDYIDPDDCPGAPAPDTLGEPLLFWYDGSDSGTITLSGDDVTEWADKSGNGYDLTPSQGGFPKVLSGALNGLDTVYFPGIESALPRMSASPVTDVSGPFTVFAVVRFDRDGYIGFSSTDHNLEATIMATGGSPGFSIMRGGGASNGGADKNVLRTNVSSGYPANGSRVPNSTPLIHTSLIDGAGSFARVNGVQTWATDTGGPAELGTFYSVGGPTGGSHPLDGYIAELIGYNAALDASQMEAIEAYLTAKWFEESVAQTDYRPYLLNVNARDVDDTFLNLDPWGYWKLDDASGAPQDSSGNNRDGSVSTGSPTYAQTPITDKVGNSIALDGTARLAFPAPANLGHIDSTPAMCALVQMTGSGNDGTGDSPWRVFMGGGAASTGWVQAFFDSSLGGSWPLDGILASLKGVNTTAMYGAVEQQIDTSYPGDDPHFIVLNAVYGAMQIWLDGVLVGQALRDSSLGGTPDLFVGADPSTFWGSPAMRVSNVATWDRNLLPSEIKMLSEAVLDSTMVASAWQPQA